MVDLCTLLGADLGWNCSTNPCPSGGSAWEAIGCNSVNTSVLVLLKYAFYSMPSIFSPLGFISPKPIAGHTATVFNRPVGLSLTVHF